MKSAKEISRSLHTRYLAILNLYRFMQQPAFEHAYDVADVNEKADAIKFVEAVDRDRLVNWTKVVLKSKKSYELLDVRYLRTLAQELGIRGYAAMGRIELVSRLQNNGSESQHEQKSGDRTSRGNENTPYEVRSDQVGKL